MKKRIFIVVLLLIMTLALFACDDKSEPAECEHSWGEWIGTSEGHYHVCTKCKTPSQVFNHNCGDVTDIVGADYVAECRVCKYMVHTPVYPVIEAADEELNSTYLAEINQAFKTLEAMGESSDISASMSMYLNHSYLSGIDFSFKNSSDLYFELRGTNPVIYHEEDGKIFQYTRSQRTKYDYERTYVCDVDDFPVLIESLGSIDTDTDVDLDVSKCNITKDGNKYTIDAYAVDMMGEEVASQLVEIYKQLGLDSEILSKITVQTVIEFTQASYKMTMDMNMVMAVEGQIVELPFEVVTEIDYSDIEKIDFLGGEYKITLPSRIEEVYAISNVTDTFEFDGRYYGVRLEKGQYYVLHHDTYYKDNVYTHGFHKFHIYDGTGEEIEALDAGVQNFCSYNFVIPEDGLYYLTFSGAQYDNAVLVRCDYETVYDVDNPKTFDFNTNGVIEGLYDVEYYTFTSESDKSMIVKNTSEVTLNIIVNKIEYVIEAGEEKSVSIQKGENPIIVVAQNLTQKTNYSLECTESALE